MVLIASCYRNAQQTSTPGAVFSSEMVCEAIIDRTMELLSLTNSGNKSASVLPSTCGAFFSL